MFVVSYCVLVLQVLINNVRIVVLYVLKLPAYIYVHGMNYINDVFGSLIGFNILIGIDEIIASKCPKVKDILCYASYNPRCAILHVYYGYYVEPV